MIALYHKQEMMHTETVPEGKIMEGFPCNFILRIFFKIYCSLVKFRQKMSGTLHENLSTCMIISRRIPAR